MKHVILQSRRNEQHPICQMVMRYHLTNGLFNPPRQICTNSYEHICANGRIVFTNGFRSEIVFVIRNIKRYNITLYR